MNDLNKLTLIGIEAELARLEKRIEQLEDKLEPQPSVPSQQFIPYPDQGRGWSPYVPSTTQPEIRRACTLCGLTLQGTLGYCCPMANCPSGLGPVNC